MHSLRAAIDPNQSAVGLREEYVCWTRMQTEAGQGLSSIVARKELERRAGNGVFFWGVGNAPAVAVRALARLGHPVPVIFSAMKTKPRAADVSPTSTLAWRRYMDSHGHERELPRHVLVTSRGETGSGQKSRHFALMCNSSVPLTLDEGAPFDPKAYRNASEVGASIGASQVTALLRRAAETEGPSDYRVNMRASLTGSYWVRLSDPVRVPSASLKVLDTRLPKSIGDWLEMVDELRSGPSLSYDLAGHRLF